MSNYLTEEEAKVINNLMPGNQNLLLGSKLKWVLDLTNPPGTVRYVDAGVSESKDGLSWDTAFKTISEANAAAVAGDTILIRAGEYDEGASIVVTKAGLKFLGQNTSSNQNNVMILGSSATHTLIDVGANEVEIAGIGFTQTKAASMISVTSGSWKAHIHGCKFDGYGAATSGVTVTGDCPDIHVERNLFRSINGSNIVSNSTRGRYNDNKFIVVAAKSGIEHTPNAGDRPDSMIEDNRFFTLDNTNAVGITVTNTPTAGALFVNGNQFVYFADDDHCISKRTGYTGLNYLGVTAVPIT